MDGLINIQWIPLLTAVIQIAILYFAVYWVLYFLRMTRGAQVFAGILVASVALALILRIESLHFDVLNSLIEMIANSLFIALVIIFQPEMRRALAQLGSFTAWQGKRKRELIVEIVTACSEMARKKCGALIVIERNIKLQSYIDDAVVLDAKVHYLLLESIFYSKSPLHDGALVIDGGRIVAARCTLPITEKTGIPASYGMRHKAAIGITEETDADAIVVSEETGKISFVKGGTVTPINNINELKLLLSTSLSNE